MSAPKPACQAAAAWILEVKGKGVLAPFTGQDFAAFKAFVHALELYAFSDDEGRKQALLCMRHAVLAMQPKTRWIARETATRKAWLRNHDFSQAGMGAPWAWLNHICSVLSDGPRSRTAFGVFCFNSPK